MSVTFKDELSLFDINDEMNYYEVELWDGWNYNSKFFRTRKSAYKFFKENAKTEFDSLKYHENGFVWTDCDFSSIAYYL